MTRQSIVDGLGRLSSVVENSGGAQYYTGYGYDLLDNLISVSQGAQGRSFHYDALKRLTSATNPESGPVSYDYYAGGQLFHKTDASNITTTMFYDAINRITSKSYSDGTSAVSDTYDDASVQFSTGRLTRVANGASTTNYLSYDAVGRVLSSSQTTGGQSYPAFHYSYNLAGVMEQYTFPSARLVTSCYDSVGRLTAAHKGDQNAASYASATAFWPHGAVQTLTLGNNVTESTVFNVRLQPTAISAANGSTSLLSIAYGYGPANNGNVTSQSIQFPSRVAADNNTVPALNVNTVYGYDAFNRINSAVETPVGSGTPNWTQGYTYDAFGNRAASGYIPYPSLTPQNLAAYSGNRWMPGGISYDNNGNQTVMQQSSFTYDAENRVRTGTVPNVAAIGYAYDGAGQRVQKTIGSSTTTYVYDAMGQLAAEYGTPTDSGTTYLTADHLGSTRLLTTSSGAVKKRYDYFPFGEDIQANLGRSTEDYGSGMYPSPPSVQALDFTGKERDAETGLDYFGARYMSAAQGRFTSPDLVTVTPGRLVDPQQLNLYAYARNNPLKFVDPTGMVIDTTQLSDADRKEWEGIKALANQQDANGNYVNGKLHEAYDRLDKDTRTFVIVNENLGERTAGQFTITKFDGPNNFSEAKVALNFKRIKSIQSPSPADFDSSFKKYEGLFGKNGFLLRLAETFGHEGNHGIFALDNLQQATQIQHLTNDRDAALQALPTGKGRYPFPPDVLQKMEAAEKALIPTERFAQQAEKIINGELRSSQVKK